MKARFKISLQATAVFLVGVLLSCTAIKYPEKRGDSQLHHLVFLHTKDTHGHPVKFFQYPAADVGGLPARATVVNRIGEQHRNVLVYWIASCAINPVTGKRELMLLDEQEEIELGRQANTSEGALKEVSRVLKEDGVLAILEFKKIDGPPGPPLASRLAPEEVEKREQTVRSWQF